MSRPTSTSRPALVLALAGMLALAGTAGVSAGVPACPGVYAGDACPMLAPEPARPCHGAGLLAADCCGAREAPARRESTSPGPTLPPASLLAAFARLANTAPPAASAVAPQASRRAAEDGLYTLHRALLI